MDGKDCFCNYGDACPARMVLAFKPERVSLRGFVGGNVARSASSTRRHDAIGYKAFGSCFYHFDCFHTLFYPVSNYAPLKWDAKKSFCDVIAIVSFINLNLDFHLMHLLDEGDFQKT
jgi:hypothetical protein